MKIVKNIQLKIVVFTAVKNFSILYGRVFVMAKRLIFLYNYDDTHMQYTASFHCCKNDNFQIKNCDIFPCFAQNIDRVCTLEPPKWVLTSIHNLCF